MIDMRFRTRKMSKYHDFDNTIYVICYSYICIFTNWFLMTYLKIIFNVFQYEYFNWVLSLAGFQQNKIKIILNKRIVVWIVSKLTINSKLI